MEVVIIMGLFDKFKNKEDVKQIKTDEQRELEKYSPTKSCYI